MGDAYCYKIVDGELKAQSMEDGMEAPLDWWEENQKFSADSKAKARAAMDGTSASDTSDGIASYPVPNAVVKHKYKAEEEPLPPKNTSTFKSKRSRKKRT